MWFNKVHRIWIQWLITHRCARAHTSCLFMNCIHHSTIHVYLLWRSSDILCSIWMPALVHQNINILVKKVQYCTSNRLYFFLMRNEKPPFWTEFLSGMHCWNGRFIMHPLVSLFSFIGWLQRNFQRKTGYSIKWNPILQSWANPFQLQMSDIVTHEIEQFPLITHFIESHFPSVNSAMRLNRSVVLSQTFIGRSNQ